MQDKKTSIPEASAQNGSKRKSERALNNAGASSSKRLRVSRACDQCRAGREKCNGVQPRCQSCELQNRPCTYNEQPKKRGIQPNYIRTLELTLAWLFQTFPASEAQLTSLLPDVQGTVHRSIASKDIARSETLHRLWRDGLVARQIDQLLSGASIDPAELSPSVGSPKVNAGGLSTHSTDQRTVHSNAVESPPTAPLVSTIASREKHALHSGKAASTTVGELENLKMPVQFWSLLEHYFAFTQSWLPITEKHDMLKIMYMYPSDGLPLATVSNGDHAELWSLMALSAIQQHGSRSEFTENLIATARALIPPRQETFELGHVKALILQSLIELSEEAWMTAWLTIGSAVRILTYLSSGMGQPNFLQIGRARHTYLAAFVLETALSCRLNVQTHLRSEVVREIGLPIEDGLEEWSPWRDPANFEAGSMTQAPIMAISSFNKLVKMAERPRSQRNRSFITSNYSQFPGLDVILTLVNNASLKEGRKQPSILVADGVDDLLISETMDRGKTGCFDSEMTSSPTNAFVWSNHRHDSQNTTLGERNPYLGIPHASNDSVTSGTPTYVDSSKHRSPAQYSSGTAHTDPLQALNPSLDVGSGAFFNADIFEELASLERTDSSSARPQFMQNLGFGPDLDLAEFFGADYQPSDPMLAYIQT